MEIKGVSQVAGAVKSFLDLVAQWLSGSETRGDKRSIKYAKDMAFLIQHININEVHMRANFDEIRKDIIKAKELAHKFFKTLD